VPTAEEGMRRATTTFLTFTGFELPDSLVKAEPSRFSQTFVATESSIPHLADSVVGRVAWRIGFENLTIGIDLPSSSSTIHVKIDSVEATVDQQTGSLIEVRMKQAGADSIPAIVLAAFAGESNWLSYDETYHSFCTERPEISLLKALSNKRSCFSGALIVVARCVNESHTMRDFKPEGPAWVLSALYAGPHEAAAEKSEETYTVKHAVVDAISGEVILRYDWWDTVENLTENYPGVVPVGRVPIL
jgi:hypothetical protein